MKAIKIPVIVAISCLMLSCGNDVKDFKKEEQLTLDEQQTGKDSLGNSLTGNATFKQLVTSPNSILMTGMNRFRLIPIYKIRAKRDRNIDLIESSSYNNYYSEGESRHKLQEDEFRYFLPGMDMIYGYNLVNVGHYDMQTGKLSYFFDKPALVRALYFPGVKADSVMKQPVFRNYFLVSAYDQDTNNDSLINKKDMRRIYHIDDVNSQKTALLPKEYSAIRSTYDYKNDLMYIYARYDSNKNGKPERSEPVSIFFIDLKQPTIARRMI